MPTQVILSVAAKSGAGERAWAYPSGPAAELPATHFGAGKRKIVGPKPFRPLAIPLGSTGEKRMWSAKGATGLLKEANFMATIYLTDEKICRLKFINKEGLKPGRYEFPDFLVIGPQRTGTGWLHKNLCSHPEIFMPAKKELYFFSKLITKSGANYSSDRIEWYSSKFEPTLYDFFMQNILIFNKVRNIRSLSFNFKKFFSSCIKGEATASYAVMPEELINEILILNENIKAIMLIRHPFDRAWSHAKKDLLRQHHKSLDEVGFNDFKAFYTKDYQVRCGKYTDIIKKWSLFLPENRFFIGKYDDISSSPKDLLKEIFVFLGISTSNDNINDYLSQAVIGTTGMENIPEEHKKFLQELFGEEISELTKKYNFDLN